jgi:hypothetical protein
MAGIVLDVAVQVMVILSVVTVSVMVLKPKQIVQKTAQQVRVALTANSIGRLMVLNAVIVPGMILVLTV